MASNITSCNDATDTIELFDYYGLYLKPIARVNVSVQLPQLKAPGKSISNWEVMEKLRTMVRPDVFVCLKVVKSTLDFIRFEGEVENKSLVQVFINRLDSKTMKLSGFPDMLKIRSAEAKVNFPSRHDWDSYFRDAKNMNEMKPGERPDTIYFKDLPSRWFSIKKDVDNDKPNEYIVKKVFETFGEIRGIDIPMLDPHRKENNPTSTIGSFTTTFGQDLVFEAYVQYMEYIGFVKAMNALRGMKLLYKEEDKSLCASVSIDFDKSKHMSEKKMSKRMTEQDRLALLETEREERVRKERQEEQIRRDDEKQKKELEVMDREKKRREKFDRKKERQGEREEKRRLRALEKKQKEEEKQMSIKIALEERKILIAQRKLETIRLLSELCNRVKTVQSSKEVELREVEIEEQKSKDVELTKIRKEEESRRKDDLERQKKGQLARQELDIRERLVKNFKIKADKAAETQRETLRTQIGSKSKTSKTKLKSAINKKK